jgi:hypothetical protein
MVARSIILQRLLAETKDIVSLMMQVPHYIIEEHSLHVVLSNIVKQHVPEILNADLL